MEILAKYTQLEKDKQNYLERLSKISNQQRLRQQQQKLRKQISSKHNHIVAATIINAQLQTKLTQYFRTLVETSNQSTQHLEARIQEYQKVLHCQRMKYRQASLLMTMNVFQRRKQKDQMRAFRMLQRRSEFTKKINKMQCVMNRMALRLVFQKIRASDSYNQKGECTIGEFSTIMDGKGHNKLNSQLMMEQLVSRTDSQDNTDSIRNIKMEQEIKQLKMNLSQRQHQLSVKQQELEETRNHYQNKISQIFEKIATKDTKTSESPQQKRQQTQSQYSECGSDTVSYYNEIENLIIGNKGHPNSKNKVSEELLHKYMLDCFQLKEKIDLVRELCSTMCQGGKNASQLRCTLGEVVKILGVSQENVAAYEETL